MGIIFYVRTIKVMYQTNHCFKAAYIRYISLYVHQSPFAGLLRIRNGVMDYQNIRTDDFTLFIQFILDIFDLYDNQIIKLIVYKIYFCGI